MEYSCIYLEIILTVRNMCSLHTWTGIFFGLVQPVSLQCLEGGEIESALLPIGLADDIGWESITSVVVVE